MTPLKKYCQFTLPARISSDMIRTAGRHYISFAPHFLLEISERGLPLYLQGPYKINDGNNGIYIDVNIGGLEEGYLYCCQERRFVNLHIARSTQRYINNTLSDRLLGYAAKTLRCMYGINTKSLTLRISADLEVPPSACLFKDIKQLKNTW